MKPCRVTAPFAWGSLLSLIRESFAYMDGVIDPPSSMHRLTEEDIARHAAEGEIWAIGQPPIACMFLTVKADRLYLGKLAVDKSHRGEGLARLLVGQALTRASGLGLRGVELQTRVELTDNHAIFRALGFTETGRTSHPGHDRPTTVNFRLDLPLESCP